ncbi:MAG: hypothetical protein WC819_06315 [Parcubacteria group bacterium]
MKNAKRRAFIEQFNYTSINFTQKNLGTIFGFFIVRDHSVSSENIVNFLASEIKKHYFSPTQKTIEEKFESTLHHINRALEELANIGNVDWLGTIDGAVCVIDDQTIHFSITGNATVILLRGDTLLNISDGLASPEAADYPLKTFADISSGDLCAYDKIIVTSQELLELVSFNELQKNATRMGQKNFIQFIETVLTNECSIASTTIIDVVEKPTSVAQTTQPQMKALPQNFFGADAFEKKPDESTPSDTPIDIEGLLNDAPQDYTDPRTGHIHIHGSDEIPQKASPLDTVSDFFSDTGEFLKKKARKQKKLFSRKMSASKNTPDSPLQEEAQDHDNIFEENAPSQIALYWAKLKTYAISAFSSMRHLTANIVLSCKKYISKVRHCTELSDEENLYPQQASYTPQKFTESDDVRKKTFLPNFHNILSAWHAMHKKTKLITIGVIGAIIIVPLIFKLISSPQQKKSSETAPKTEEQSQSQISTPAPVAPAETPTEKPALTPTSLMESTTLSSVVVVNATVIGVEKNALTIITQEKQRISLPNDAGNIALTTSMPDLNMIFVITDTDRMYSFSPASPKFIKQDNIPTLDHTKIKGIGTFMTYLYIADDTMIRRYVRIEGGFDEGKDWLKKPFDFKTITSLAIGESIYVAQDTSVTQFTQGNKDTTTLDPTITHPSLLLTTRDMNFLWIVDTASKMLYKIDKKNGAISDKYVHDNFAQATSLAVDEKSETAYITSQNTISSYSLKN